MNFYLFYCLFLMLTNINIHGILQRIMLLNDWIRLCKSKGASDLHLETGSQPILRVRGELCPLSTLTDTSSSDLVLQCAREQLPGQAWADFLTRGSADLSRTISGVRCRINIYKTFRGVGMAIRLLSSFQNTLSSCNLHPDFAKFVRAKSGLVLVSGPTGSGKSTTVAALIEEINHTQRRHILTLESPIEYVYSNRQSLVHQREIPTHSPNFEHALIDAMRENPDVLVIGEMRSPEVMRLTLNAAETGHLVIATLHSSSCAEAITRMCMSFSADIQPSIRAQLSDCLRAVICQRLIYNEQQQMDIPLCEILLASTGAKGCIASGQTNQLLSVIQSGGQDGMWSFDRYARWIEQKRDWIRPHQATPLDNIITPEPALESLRAPFMTTRERPITPPPFEFHYRERREPVAPPSMQTRRPPTRLETEADDMPDDNRLILDDVDDDLEALAQQIVARPSVDG